MYIVTCLFQICFLRRNYIDLQLKIIAVTQIMVNKCIIKIHSLWLFESNVLQLRCKIYLRVISSRIIYSRKYFL